MNHIKIFKSTKVQYHTIPLVLVNPVDHPVTGTEVRIKPWNGSSGLKKSNEARIKSHIQSQNLHFFYIWNKINIINVYVNVYMIYQNILHEPK